MSNPAQPDSSLQNPESGQDVAKQSVLGHSEKPISKPERSIARSHAKYWEARLFRPTYTRDGENREVNDLAIRIQHGGRRAIFPLHTTNKSAAAVIATGIHRF